MEHGKRMKDPSKETSLFLCGAVGGVVGLGIAAVLALLLPIALLRFDDPSGFVVAGTAFCVFAGSAAGALTAALRCKNAPIQSGLISAAVMTAIMLVLSFIIPGSIDILQIVLLTAVSAASAVLTSLVVSNTNRKGRRNMKKAMKRR